MAICVVTNGANAADAGAPADAAAAAAAFGLREDVEQISLSPDAKQVAYIAPYLGQGSVLVVRDVADDAQPRPIAKADGKPNRLGGCHWVSNARLVCTTYGTVNVEGRMVPFSRLFAVNTTGADVKQLSTRENSNSRGLQLGGGEVIDWLPDEDGSVLMTRRYLPDDKTGSLIGSARQGLAVDRVDTDSLKVRGVEPPKDKANDYISDGRGTVRIMGLQGIASGGDMMTSVTHYSYRLKDSRTWQKLGDYDYQTREGFNPYAVDSDRNLAYGFKKSDGRSALYSVALDGTLKETLLFARPDVDISGLARIGRRNRVIGAAYQTDRPEIAYLDPEIEKLARSLSKALPNQPSIRVVDSSIDERKLLIFAGSDDDPGAYYLLDRDKRDLHTFLAVRPQLAAYKLSAMKPVRYAAADGTMIPAYLTLPAGAASLAHLPAIVMPHGGPSSRDEWGFDWLPQFYASQGYAVLQPQFRGSAGYGDAWFQKNGFRSWRTAIGDVADAGRWLVAQGADPAKLAILGWSYGGYAALQSAVIAPDLFKAVVAIAPVTDLATLRGESMGWSDEQLVRRMVGVGPEVSEGSPAQNAARIKVPVLLVHGRQDANVGYGESTLMASRLKSAGGKVQLITFDDLDHYLEDADARKKLLLESDSFLRAATGR